MFFRFWFSPSNAVLPQPPRGAAPVSPTPRWDPPGLTKTLKKQIVLKDLNLLVEKKLVNCVRLQDAIQRYEAADTAHHHHFHCEICDKVYVIKGCYLHFHNEDQKIPEGHTINSHEITFHGVCRNCKSDLSCNS